MLETSARLLRLLSLLQARRDWTSAELAVRLDVTTRTIRNDVARLRALGYPVDARPGVAGGYRLGSGSSLPPLLLDDEETVAVAIGLRTAANGSVAGIEEASVRALAKLQQVLPSRLRHRVSAFVSSALPVPSRGPQVDPDVLTLIASACRDHERLRFDYRSHSGTASRRSVEPYRLVNDRRRWYLVAWDEDRDAWRTFRVDRIEPRPPAGPRFNPRALPPDREIAAQVARGAGEATWQYRARVIVHAPAAHVRKRLPIPVAVDSLGDDRCAFEPGSDHPQMLAPYLGLLGARFTSVDSPEVRRQHGLLEPQPDGPPFSRAVLPVERQPAARALLREHAHRRRGRGDVQEAAAAVLALVALPAVHPHARPALDPVGGRARDAEHLRHRGGEQLTRARGHDAAPRPDDVDGAGPQVDHDRVADGTRRGEGAEPGRGRLADRPIYRYSEQVAQDGRGVLITRTAQRGDQHRPAGAALPGRGRLGRRDQVHGEQVIDLADSGARAVGLYRADRPAGQPRACGSQRKTALPRGQHPRFI